MEKKYQFFISSTYEDLKEERLKVRDTILLLGHFPYGMESFNASDNDKWIDIKKRIDECDYYVLILAGMYGSEDPETNTGYVQKEYEYAIQQKIPVVAFIYSNIKNLPQEKIEQDPKKLKKLNQFRELVINKRMCKLWSSPSELTTHVSTSLVGLMKDNPRRGWIRPDAISNNILKDNSIAPEVRISNENFIGSRFSRAIEHLCSSEEVISLGGVYELHTIAQESKMYRPHVFELLCNHIKKLTRPYEKNMQEILKEWENLSISEKCNKRIPEFAQRIFNIIYDKGNAIYRGLYGEFKNLDLRGIKLVGLQIENADFSGSVLNNAAMYSHENGCKDVVTIFKDCTFYYTYLAGANMCGSIFINCHFPNAHMYFANFYGCEFINTQFDNADMTCSILSHTSMENVSFKDTILDGSELKDINFRYSPKGKNYFINTKFNFASVFTLENFYNRQAVFVNNIETTGMQTSLQYYKGYNRIDRILRYYNISDNINLININYYEETDKIKRSQIYCNIIEKIIKYISSNNHVENIEDQSIIPLKDVLNILNN